MHERCHSDEAFLLHLSSSVHWWVCCVAVACDQTLCIIAETKENVQVLGSRRSVSWLFLVSRCARHDKGDRLRLPPNQSWHFSFYSGFSTISFVLFVHSLPHIPSLCSVVQSLSLFHWLAVTSVREIVHLMAAPHVYPNIPDLFAMCGHILRMIHPDPQSWDPLML